MAIFAAFKIKSKMKKLKSIIAVAGIATLIFSCNSTKKSMETEPFSLKNDVDSVSYSLGVSIATNLKSQGFDTVNQNALKQAFKDVYGDEELLIDANQANAVIQEFMTKKQNAAAGDNAKEGRKFLEENGKKDGVTTTATGLQYEVMKEGTGAKPSATDKVTVHYHGMLLNGEVFDSSVDRGQPATFGLNQVIPGWTEGVQLMSVGSKYKFFIPSELAYGSRGAGGKIGPGATLIFEVELLEITAE